MQIEIVHDFFKGQRVKLASQESVNSDYVITSLGSDFAVVTDVVSGDTKKVSFGKLAKANMVKTAQNKILAEDARDDINFVLSKDEQDIDGEIHVKYIMTANDETVWESEEITTNVYDSEYGWSAPDDFDDNKLELLEQTAQSGFSMMVDSYQNIKEQIESTVATPSLDGLEGDGKDKEPPDVKAFAPGEEPAGGAGGGAGAGAGGDATPSTDEDVPEEGGEDVEAPEEVDDAVADVSAEEPELATASIDQPFTRRIAKKGGDDRLRGNPQHRLNPILRSEMEKRKIDSGDTHDIELADKLKDFDWGKKASKRIASKLDKLSDKNKS